MDRGSHDSSAKLWQSFFATNRRDHDLAGVERGFLWSRAGQKVRGEHGLTQWINWNPDEAQKTVDCRVKETKPVSSNWWRGVKRIKLSADIHASVDTAVKTPKTLVS